jgi:hypothetical protein
MNERTRQEVGRLMKAYLPFHIGRELRSAAFLEPARGGKERR